MTKRSLYCPTCARRYRIQREKIEGRNLLVLCGNCENLFEPSLVEEPVSKVELAKETTNGSVLVAHESPSVCTTVSEVVRQAGYVPRCVNNGAAALAAFDASFLDTPMALVMDVGIPNVLAFDVVKVLRQRQAQEKLPIILLASVFDPTRYKRRPTSLYGADAYLELHHIPDRLPKLLRAGATGTKEENGYRPHFPREFALAEAIRVGSSVSQSGSHSSQAATVARRIISDIALYHEQELIDGLEKGTLEEQLADVLREGRALYEQEVSELSGIEGDPFTEAIEELTLALRRRAAP